MSATIADYELYERVLQKEPGSRTLAECCVLDEWASRVPLLEHLDKNSRLEICQAATTKTYMNGRTIVASGKLAERMVILLSGQASIMVESLRGPKCVASIGPGGTFGELELLTGGKHTSSAVAVNSVIIVSVDAETFDSTLAPTYGKELFRRARFLQSTTPFRSWTMASLIEFVRSTQCITTIRGKQISDDARQAKQKRIYFVVSGTVEVHGSDEAASTLQGAGSFWGLSCIFQDLPGDGVVTAHSSNVELLTLSAKALQEKVDEKTLRHMADVAGFAHERTKQRSQRSQRSQRTVSFASSAPGPRSDATSVVDAVMNAESGQASGSAVSMDGNANSDDCPSPTASESDLCSQIIARAAAAVPREQLARTPSGWLPLQVDENPRPSLKRVWAANDAAQGIAIHMDELITLLDSNESLLSQLSGESCLAIVNALGAVNKILDATGLWRGHSSAQDARRQVEMEAELCSLTGQTVPYETNMGRLQLEVLLKLTSARIKHLIEKSEVGDNSENDASFVNGQLNLDVVHAKISECLECAHRQLLEAPALGGLDALRETRDHSYRLDDEHGHLPTTLLSPPGPVALEDSLRNVVSTKDMDHQKDHPPGTVCRIGGVAVPFASGRWVWLSKSRTSVFPYGEEENAIIEQAFANYSAAVQGGGQEQEQLHEREAEMHSVDDDDVCAKRTVMLPDNEHFIDFEQMRQIRCDSHELFKDVKRLRAGIDRFEP